MRTLFLLLLLAGAAPLARAQTYYLDLGGLPLDVPDRAVAVEQVLDGRGQPGAIGFVYKKMGNKPAAVLFRQGLGPALTALAQQLPARPTDHPVVLCLRQVRISETIGSWSEQASADLAADVYAHLPDGYHFVQSVGPATTGKSLDVTGQHARHLAALLGTCLGQLSTADWAAAAARPALPLSQLPTDAPAVAAGSGRRGPSAAILREVPRRGLYHSFAQFAANQPDTLFDFRIDTVRQFHRSELAARKWRGVVRLRPVPDSPLYGVVLPEGLWGFSDGRQLFVHHQRQFFPLVRQGSFFTFVGEAPPDLEYARARAEAQGRAMVMAGVVGVGVAGTRVPDHTGEPAAYALDMRTGGLAPYPGPASPNLPRADTAYVYVYRPAAPAGSDTVQVLLDGQAAGTLRPGEYLELPWPYVARTLHLCLTGVPATTACQYLVPNAGRPHYLRVTPGAPTGPWQWVPPAQGNADLDALDRQRP